MTDLSRGTRPRRGGRRPGWLLLTVLLVLAIAASSALVFTERVELLKLAVILSLWAAAAAAFVSVIYRRQSDLDRARARDLKMVYDLQLDREISARREYELEVESQLRRELSSELRNQAADEVAALRAELAALRNNLEIMFDADLTHRPAIETDRPPVRAYSDWQRDTDAGSRGGARFVAQAARAEPEERVEDAIIDVPEEPAIPEEDVRVEAPHETFVAATEHPAEPRWDFPPAPEPQQPHSPRLARHGNERGQDDTWAPATNGHAPSSPQPPAPPAEPVYPAPHPGRHSAQPEPVGAPPARHATARERFVPPSPPPPQAPPPPPTSRHGATDDAGQSVADLLARLQATATSSGGGRRRRRDD